MSHDSDVASLYREVHDHQKRVRAERKVQNLAVLNASGLPFTYRNRGDVVLVRDKRYPAVDFWPSTNHWRVGTKNMMGDAAALIGWLKRRAL